MIILTQTRNKIEEVYTHFWIERIYENGKVKTCDICGVKTFDDAPFLMGTYATEKRVLEVFKELCLALKNESKIYAMPKE